SFTGGGPAGAGAPAPARREDRPPRLAAATGTTAALGTCHWTAAGGPAGRLRLPRPLQSQPAETASQRTGVGALGEDADRAHGGRELARPELHAHARGSAAAKGALRKAANGGAGGGGCLAGAIAAGGEAAAPARHPRPAEPSAGTRGQGAVAR